MRIYGIDTVTGKHKPKQLGTYQSQRSANAAAGGSMRSLTRVDIEASAR